MFGFLAAMFGRRTRKENKQLTEGQSAYREQRRMDMIAEGIKKAKAGAWPGPVAQRPKNSPPHGR